MKTIKKNIICVCNEADSETCAVCPKGLAISPVQTYRLPAWKRNVEKYQSSTGSI